MRRGGRDVVDVGRRHHEVERLVGVGIVDDVGLGAANAGRKRRPLAAQAAQSHAGRIDQADAIADLPAIAVLQLSDQRREQPGKHFHGARRIRSRQGRLRDRAAAKVIKLAGVALQGGFDLPKAARPAKLRVQHRDQVWTALRHPIVPIGAVAVHKTVERRPRNLLQKAMKNDILVRHGVNPLAVQMIRNQLNPSRINAVHFIKQKTCRTVVGVVPAIHVLDAKARRGCPEHLCEDALRAFARA